MAFQQTAAPQSPDTGVAQRLSGLTARERGVLELIAQGHDNSHIAQALSLSEKTVRNYVTSIFDKLQVSSRPQAIVLAREAGYGHAPLKPAH
ncbi:MAG: response regulator transcription factor [Betaproteobacteria bacterium]|nr:response regulator transcription factor [Betaproteobacteria bacterium]